MIKKFQIDHWFYQSILPSTFLGTMIGYVITEFIGYFADTDVFKKGLFWKWWYKE